MSELTRGACRRRMSGAGLTRRLARGGGVGGGGGGGASYAFRTVAEGADATAALAGAVLYEPLVIESGGWWETALLSMPDVDAARVTAARPALLYPPVVTQASIDSPTLVGTKAALESAIATGGQAIRLTADLTGDGQVNGNGDDYILDLDGYHIDGISVSRGAGFGDSAHRVIVKNGKCGHISASTESAATTPTDLVFEGLEITHPDDGLASAVEFHKCARIFIGYCVIRSAQPGTNGPAMYMYSVTDVVVARNNTAGPPDATSNDWMIRLDESFDGTPTLNPNERFIIVDNWCQCLTRNWYRGNTMRGVTVCTSPDWELEGHLAQALLDENGAGASAGMIFDGAAADNLADGVYVLKMRHALAFPTGGSFFPSYGAATQETSNSRFWRATDQHFVVLSEYYDAASFAAEETSDDAPAWNDCDYDTGSAVFVDAQAIEGSNGVEAPPLIVYPRGDDPADSDPRWTPALLSPIWGIRADLDTIALNGSDVSGWTDRGPSGWDCSQTTAVLQPLYVASVAGLNQRPAVRFTGSEYMTMPSALGAALRDTAAVTWLWVGSGSGSDAVFRNIVAAHNSAFTNVRSFRKTSTGLQQMRSVADNSVTCTGGTNIGTGYRYGSGTDTGTLGNLRLDAVADGTADQDLDAGTFVDLSLVSLGCVRPTGSPQGFWSGDLAEVWIFDRVLTAGELGQFESYVQGWYGL